MQKIKTNGDQILNVPNTPEGIAFLSSLSQFLNKKYSTVKYGRGSRPEYPKYQGYCPHTLAKWFAVYLQTKNCRGNKETLHSLYHQHEIGSLQSLNAKLNAENKTLQSDLEETKKQIEVQHNRIMHLANELAEAKKLINNRQPPKTYKEILSDFAGIIGKELKINVSILKDNKERYSVYFNNGEIKDGPMLISEYGCGDSLEQACHAYATIISGKTIVFDAFRGSSRQEIKMPFLQ